MNWFNPSKSLQDFLGSQQNEQSQQMQMNQNEQINQINPNQIIENNQINQMEEIPQQQIQEEHQNQMIENNQMEEIKPKSTLLPFEETLPYQRQTYVPFEQTLPPAKIVHTKRKHEDKKYTLRNTYDQHFNNNNTNTNSNEMNQQNQMQMTEEIIGYKKLGFVINHVEGKTIIQGGGDIVENGTMLYDKENKELSVVEDVFGQITDPFYVISSIVPLGEDVFVMVKSNTFVDVNTISRYGSDATGVDDIEIDENDRSDFSDDEQERLWKQKRKMQRRENGVERQWSPQNEMEMQQDFDDY